MRKQAILAVALIIFSSMISMISSVQAGDEFEMGSIDSIDNVNDNGDLPGEFIENKGQWDEQILFTAEIPGGHVCFTMDSIYYFLNEVDSDHFHRIRIDFIGTSEPVLNGIESSGHIMNYISGNDRENWATGVLGYSSIIYEDLWDGIDMKYYFSGSGLKYDIILQPDADPDEIRFDVRDVESINVDDMALEIRVNNAISIYDTGLSISYDDGENEIIHGSFKKIDERSYGFDLEKYDRNRPVIIDPMIYSTCVGGERRDYGYDSCTDSQGNLFLVGDTESFFFPLSGNAYQSCINHSYPSIFVNKKFGGNKSMAYSTYIRGGHTSETRGGSKGRCIEVDSSGNAIVSGYTTSEDFPVTSNAYNKTEAEFDVGGQGYTIVMFKLNSNGSDLVFSTYIGGGTVYDMELDDEGNPVITGQTGYSTYPSTTGSFEDTYFYGNNAFVTKVKSDGSDLLFSGFIHGKTEKYGADVYGRGLAIAEDGSIYVTGHANTGFRHDFLTTSDAYGRESYGGASDIFISRISGDGKKLYNCTLFGGKNGSEETAPLIEVQKYYNGRDFSNDIFIDMDGNILITGYTTSKVFPTTNGAYFNTTIHNQANYVFAAKFNMNLTELLNSTLIHRGEAIGISATVTDMPVICGSTKYTTFPVTEDAFEDTHGGGTDVFLTRMDEHMKKITYSTFIGGRGDDYPESLEQKGRYSFNIAGSTISTNFPVTANGTGINVGENWTYYDAFLTVFEMVPDSIPYALQGEMRNETVSLSWKYNPIQGVNLISFNIYRMNGTGHFFLLGNTNTASYDDNKVSSSQDYTYYIKAVTSKGESKRSVYLKISDDDPPEILDLIYPETVSTGSILNVSSDVRDNNMIYEVKLVFHQEYVGYKWITMTYFDGRYHGEIEVPPSLLPITIMVTAVDLSGNSVNTDEKIIQVVDNDPPKLTDRTEGNPRSGTDFTLRVEVLDGLLIMDARAIYWFDNGKIQNVSMMRSNGDNFTLDIEIPYTDVVLNYRFYAEDTEGNLNITGIFESAVHLLEIEFVTGISLPGVMYTGSIHSIDIMMNNCTLIDSANLLYGFGDEMTSNISRDPGPIVKFEISAPCDRLDDLIFMIKVSDRLGNWFSSSIGSVDVKDNVLPIIDHDSFQCPVDAGTGTEIYIEGVVVDNIELDHVNLLYRINDGKEVESTMEIIDGVYSANVTIPEDEIGQVTYRVMALDTSGNSIISEEMTVPIVDVIEPFILPVDDLVISKGDYLNLTIVVSDNIGLSDWVWEESPFHLSGLRISERMIDVGIFDFVFKAMDDAGNTGILEFVVEVIEVDSEPDCDDDVDDDDDPIGDDDDDVDDDDKDDDTDDDDIVDPIEDPTGDEDGSNLMVILIVVALISVAMIGIFGFFWLNKRQTAEKSDHEE